MAGKAVLVSIFMEKLQDVKGLGGMLNGFRDLVKDDEKIAFVGSPGFCTPFALFLGYPVREKELAFVPGLAREKTRQIVATEYGMELGGSGQCGCGRDCDFGRHGHAQDRREA